MENIKIERPTLEQCLRQTEVKSIKLEAMAISCHRRLPRRQTTERSKDTLKDSDLRSIYRELGYQAYGMRTFEKNLLGDWKYLQ